MDDLLCSDGLDIEHNFDEAQSGSRFVSIAYRRSTKHNIIVGLFEGVILSESDVTIKCRCHEVEGLDVFEAFLRSELVVYGITLASEKSDDKLELLKMNRDGHRITAIDVIRASNTDFVLTLKCVRPT